MEAGLLKQILVNDGGQVLMISNMLGEDYEGNGNISNSDGKDILGSDGLEAFESLHEGEVRNPFHGAESGEIEHFQCVIAVNVADQGEDEGNNVAGNNTDNEGNQLHHFLSLDGAEDNRQQGDKGADQADPALGIHDISAVIQHSTLQGITDGVAGQGQSDDGNGGSDDDGGHELTDPGDTGELDDGSDDHINQAGEKSAQYQAGIADRSGGGTAKSSEHGTEEGKAGTKEDRALKLGEEQVDNGTDAGAEKRGALAHAVANDAGDGNGRSQDRKQLLERKDDQLTELGFVIDLVNQIHRGDLLIYFSEGLVKKKPAGMKTGKLRSLLI